MRFTKEKGGMGFREFLCFNRAFLVWRVWKILDSLIARVMKEKYFPTCEVLDVTLVSKPLFAWRSIFSSKELLQKGLMWQIRNGEKAQIWGRK